MAYDVDVLLDKMQPYQGRQKMLKQRQRSFDIITAVLRMHSQPKVLQNYDRIAKGFWRGNIRDTASGLYWYAKQHLPYREEKEKTQTVKTPAAILEERLNWGNDCKHYASFIVGVGEALSRAGYPVKCFYRFASYKKGVRAPGHVFAVFVDKGKEIWIDPVPQIKSFDEKVLKPFYVIDKMPPMSRSSTIGSLYEISGIEDTRRQGLEQYTLGRHHHGLRHWLEQNEPRNFIRHLPGQKILMFNPAYRGVMSGDEMGKAKKHHHGLHIKIKPKFLLKYTGVVNRNAFLLLVKLNTFHLATKMWAKAAHDTNSDNWKKLAKAWKNIGGKPSKLLGEIKRGVKTYNKLHKAKKHVVLNGFDEYLAANYGPTTIMRGIDDDDSIQPHNYIGNIYDDNMTIGEILNCVRANHAMRMRSIGVVQAVAAAGVIAAALPIIKALSGLLHSFGINTKKADDAAGQDASDLAGEVEKGKKNDDGTVTTEDGKVVDVKEGADGKQELHVKHMPGTSDKEQDASDGDGDAPPPAPGKKTTGKEVAAQDDGDGEDKTPAKGDDAKPGAFAKLNAFINAHKIPMAMVGGGTLGLVFSLSMRGKKGSALKPFLGIASGAAIVFGTVQLLKKQ